MKHAASSESSRLRAIQTVEPVPRLKRIVLVEQIGRVCGGAPARTFVHSKAAEFDERRGSCQWAQARAIQAHRPSLHRFLFLKTLAAAPLDSESARAFLQRRLLFLVKLFALLTIGLHLYSRLVRWKAPREMDSLMGTQLTSAQLVMLGLFALMILRLRKGQRSQLECCRSSGICRCSAGPTGFALRSTETNARRARL
jgi:hypothetical protein